MSKSSENVLIWIPAERSRKIPRSGLILQSRWAQDPKIANPESGDLYGYLGHVLSWHDLELPPHGNIRVWIHSLSRSRIKREFLSIQVELHGTVFPDVEPGEADARMKLAVLTSTFRSEAKLKSTLLRDLPSGQTFENHSKILDAFFESIFGKKDNVVRLIDGPSESKKKPRSSKNIELRTTAKDAILIAKLYALRTELSGSSKAAKRIHEDYGIDLATIYTAIRLCRTKGWLHKGDKGVAGGKMTQEGEEFFTNSDGPARLEKITGLRIGGDNRG